MGGAGVRAGPVKANEDGFAVDAVVCVKLAVAVAKFAHLGRVEQTDSAVGPIEAPLAGCGVEKAKRQAFDVAGWAVEFNGVQRRPAVPDRITDTGALQVGPCRRAGEWVLETFEVVVPAAQQRFEVVRANWLCGSWRSGC